MSNPASDLWIAVSLTQQLLRLFAGDQLVREYLVSSSRYGPGEQSGSQCTPRGRHVIRARIGDKAPAGAVFVGRRPTGEIYSPELCRRFPRRDWILSRILWLSGRELGANRLGQVDSMRRFIYIHGTPDSEPVGVPFSHGCIRMRNTDVIDLYSRVSVGITVEILANGF